MRAKAFRVGLAAAGLLAASAAAVAMESPEMFLQAVNTNADKTVSMREVDAYAMKRFNALNRNATKDGTLSHEEIGERMTAAEFAAANTTHGSKFPTLSRAEFKAYVDKLFAEANVSVAPGRTDADGTLSRRELETPAGRKLIRLLE